MLFFWGVLVEPSWLSILPPLLAIILAVWTREVYLALFLGIWVGWTVLYGWNPLAGLIATLEAAVRTLTAEGSAKVIAFSLVVGALMALTQRSGGVFGFVNWISRWRLARSRRGAGFLAWLTGIIVFVESNITCLVVGSVARPIFDRLRISREKLSYICDSTSAPVCILIPLNAWGAYLVGLLSREGVEAPVSLLIRAVPLNFYALVAVLLVLAIVLTGWDMGPMARAERRAGEEGKLLRDGARPAVSAEVMALPPKEGVSLRPLNMLVPLGVMVGAMPLGLFITGHGNLLAGSGETAVFWAVALATLTAILLYMAQRIFSLREATDLTLSGMGGMVPLAVLMVLAFTLGDLCRELGTGPFVAGLTARLVVPELIPAIVFLSAAFISFATGTSWGTYAIMIPIAVPLAQDLGASLPLTVAAVMGGGVFGDHSSPISDTTLVSSMASVADPIDHVRTQLPYALLAAGVALGLFLLFGLLG